MERPGLDLREDSNGMLSGLDASVRRGKGVVMSGRERRWRHERSLWMLRASMLLDVDESIDRDQALR